jgi:hypothetical protein
MAAIFTRSYTKTAGALLVWAFAAWPLSCGGGDDGGGGKKSTNPDASSGGSGGSGGSGNSGGKVDGAAGVSTGGSGGGGAGDSGVDVVDSGGPIDAQDATYTIELGSQVDEHLTSQHPGNSSVSYAMKSQPTLGEILHFDQATGRFVYTSISEGTDSFDFEILENGKSVDSATITVTTKPLEFVGDWRLTPGGSCSEYQFTVAQTDAGYKSITPLVSSCIKQASGMSSIPLGGTTTHNEDEQSLGVVSCVNDIQGVNYCYAFRYWRITSRDDFQSIETVSGTKTVGGQQYLISGQVRGLVHHVPDTTSRAAVAGQSTPIVQLGVTDGTPKTQAVTLENKGSLPAKLGTLGLPSQAKMDGGYPGTNGTCGATLDPGKTCTVMLTITATAPATGDSESVPLSVYFSDDVGYDVSRLRINWTWATP